MTYATTVQEILATAQPETQYMELGRHSDALLYQLEQLNLDAYRSYPPEQLASPRRAAREDHRPPSRPTR